MNKFIYKICNESEWFYAKKKKKFKGTRKDVLDGSYFFPSNF